jgi:PKD repeat protein
VVRKFLYLVLLIVLVTMGQTLVSPAAQAADTGKTAPQTGKIVSDEPGKNAPNILDGTVYSITKVGNTIVVGGQFTQVQNFNTSTTLTRRNVFAFDATTGKISTTFNPDPSSTVYKVQAAADGTSVYVAGGFGAVGGVATPSRLFKADVTTGVIDASFAPPTISGDIRDLEVVGNRLWVAGKFTHLGGVAQKALGTLNATTGKYDSYFTGVMAGLHRTNHPEDLTNVLQISSNPTNTRLMVVGNFTSVDGVARAQAAQFDISGPTYALSTWSTNLYTSACSGNFETTMTDVEYSPNGQFFIISTTAAWGGMSSATGGNGCDVVARFENNTTAGSVASWTAYTGGDTTWTVEVTDNVVYAGGHMSWQNNPIGANVAAQGAVSREGIAALNPVNGMPYSWNPTRARGVGVQDLMATSDGLYVGSDTTLIGHTAGNTYHARIAVLPLAGGATLPQLQTNALPANLYRVASGASQLTRRSFTGTTATAAVNVPTGPGWGTSTGAFMVNGVLYKTNTDGSLSRMTFDGTNYGPATAVNTADALVTQTDWHNDAKTITSLFYAEGRIYYTLSGQNALFRRGFEIESGVVGQQRFSTTTTGVTWSAVRGAFVANGKLYYTNTAGLLFSATWNQAAHAPVAGTLVTLSAAGTGWASRALFPFQAVPAPVNEAPLASATISCAQLTCSFDGTASSDPEAGPLTYDWDFGDGTAHGTGATTTHTYGSAGDRPVTLKVTDNKSATASTTKTASPTDVPDNISFVGSSTTNGNRSSHTVPVPAGTQAGDTMLLFFSSNSTGPVYTGPTGWTEVQTDNGASFVGKLYSKTATPADLGTSVTITSKNADTTAYFVRSDTTIASYRGLGSPPLTVSAITSQNVAGAVHQTPTVNAPDGKGWLVSYWSDKSSTAAATAWTGPASQTKRSQGTGIGSNHMSSLVMDSNGRVNTGGQGGLNATSETSAVGLTMSVLLSGGTPPPANQAPVAHASPVSCTQLACHFDGTTSTDPDGDTLTYDWNWNDATPHGTTATADHTFGSGGTKSVTLTVTDPGGKTGTDTVPANPVSPPVNQAPTAAITDEGCVDLTCTFNGSTSDDPDHDTLTYSWNFGDGTAVSTAPNPTHTYAAADAGARTVTLTVNDGHSHSATDTVTVNPAVPVNLAPTAAITNPTCTGLTCSFTGSTSSDPENGTLTYNWDFGDNSTDATTTNAQRTYAGAGPWTVTLTVTDSANNTDTDTVVVNPTPPANGAPIAAITNPGCTDMACSFTGSTSSDPDNDPLTYEWDFGDNSTDATTTNAQHTYSAAGPWTVTLTVRDNASHSDTDTVVVNPTPADPNPVSNVTYVGSASNAGNSTSRTVTLPSGVQVGDTMLLFLGGASIAPTYTGPAGWTLLDSKNGSTAMAARLWTKTATQADTLANAKATVTASVAAKADLTVAVYRGTDGTTPIATLASKIDNAAGAAHTSPAVTATGDTNWLVTYWADRSNTTTAFNALTGPDAPTVRRAGLASDTGSAHAIGLLADSNGPVAAGAQGQLTATANGDSSRGASFSILLKSN